MITEASYGGWESAVGYEEFLARAMIDLEAKAPDVLASISLRTVSTAEVHPNGFLKTVLASDESGELRLHIWPTGRVDDLTPHSHPWHLASKVLAGTYIEYLPTVKLDDNARHELMVPTYDNQRRQLGIVATGRTVSFELGELYEYPAGMCHFLPAGAFHITPLPVDRPFITLARTGPQLFDTPSFVKREQNQEEQLTITADRRRLSNPEAEYIWQQLQSILYDRNKS